MNYIVKRFRCDFDGIYAWGTCWRNEEVRKKWDEFWENYPASVSNEFSPVWWHFARVRQDGATGYLACHFGSIFLHPMYIEGLLMADQDGFIESAFTELEAICKEVADYCGGTFSIITQDLPKYVIEETK